MTVDSLFKDQVGTPAYMAPEIHNRQPYLGWAVDVWSLGILLFIMLTGQIPFISKNIEELPELVQKGAY